jgi:hypothetical protein
MTNPRDSLTNGGLKSKQQFGQNPASIDAQAKAAKISILTRRLWLEKTMAALRNPFSS